MNDEEKPMSRRIGWTLLMGANVLLWLMLSFYRMSDAAPPSAQMPFASAEQRSEIVSQLKEINAELKEVNAMLHSGELKVIVRPEEKK
jgi:type VI protein secretion system component VasK